MQVHRQRPMFRSGRAPRLQPLVCCCTAQAVMAEQRAGGWLALSFTRRPCRLPGMLWFTGGSTGIRRAGSPYLATGWLRLSSAAMPTSRGSTSELLAWITHLQMWGQAAEPDRRVLMLTPSCTACSSGLRRCLRCPLPHAAHADMASCQPLCWMAVLRCAHLAAAACLYFAGLGLLQGSHAVAKHAPRPPAAAPHTGAAPRCRGCGPPGRHSLFISSSHGGMP